jgi:hypothetical protein
VVDIVDDCGAVTDPESLFERPPHSIRQPYVAATTAVPLLRTSHSLEEIDDAGANDATADGREWGQLTAGRIAAGSRRRRNDRNWTPGIYEPMGISR